MSQIFQMPPEHTTEALQTLDTSVLIIYLISGALHLSRDAYHRAEWEQAITAWAQEIDRRCPIPKTTTPAPEDAGADVSEPVGVS